MKRDFKFPEWEPSPAGNSRPTAQQFRFARDFGTTCEPAG
jgi:hypothetical protein